MLALGGRLLFYVYEICRREACSFFRLGPACVNTKKFNNLQFALEVPLLSPERGFCLGIQYLLAGRIDLKDAAFFEAGQPSGIQINPCPPQ